MLIENKFIYVSLPRRGSTSFHYSCILHNFEIKNTEPRWGVENSKIDFNNINESDIMNYIAHGHEPLNELQNKFGNDYPIIAVNRDRYSSFYSLLQHVVFDLERAGFNKVSQHFSNLSSNDLFFWNTDDLVSKKRRWEIINDYLYKNDLISGQKVIPKTLLLYSEEYLINILDILLTPASFWHNHNKNIIWFDIDNLSEMENWVSDITKKSFKLKKVNSSKHINTKLILDDEFIKKYNSIYDYYDLPKSTKTLI
jgi:hypothetical protein